ncbi:MAG: c-type cytochrome [Vicinamibacterales bacterium]
MRLNLVRLALLSAGLSIAGCHSTPDAASHATPAPVLARPDVHATYIKDHAVGYDWFAHASDAYSGVPLVLLRSLPDLAPDIWGKPEEQFSRFGYLANPGGPLPLGLSWDSMDSGVTAQPLHPVALTCGACHIGRVTLDDGTSMALVGGPNTEFDVRMWRKAFERTVHEHLGTPADLAAAAARLGTTIAEKPANYFYRNARGVTAEVEAGERTYVTANAAAILTGFAGKILLGEQATNKQKATSYSKPNAPPLDGGSPGQSDGSGDLLPRLLLLDTVASLGPAKTMAGFMGMSFKALPEQLATFTDILSTWRQGTQHIAQVDGSVKSPFFRNIAASVAVAGDPKMVNVRNAAVTAEFISQLPPPLYPFAIDAAAAERGQAIFTQNCAACHRERNDNVYPTDLIGTDPNRSRVLNADGLALFLRHFAASVPAEFDLIDAKGVKYKPHDIAPADMLFDRSRPENQGYVTNALDGLWARSPYLHNGSVPTVYHVLVPSSRPEKFVRGAVSYDKKNVGFDWDPARLTAYRAAYPTAATFDTAWDGASRFGHDTNLTIDQTGHIIKKGWDGTARQGELQVRLDWSGTEHQAALAALLDYLKTL